MRAMDGSRRCNLAMADGALYEVGGRTRPQQAHDLGLVALRGPHGDVEQLGHFF